MTTLLLALTAALVLHLLPGAALQRIFLRQAHLNLAERFALALGIGIGLPPLLLEIAPMLGVRWDAGATAIYLGICALVLLIRKPARLVLDRKSVV